MKLASYIKSSALQTDERVFFLLAELASGGSEAQPVSSAGELPSDADMLLSIGGDGTFLSAASMAAPLGVPVLGVNLGRLGFLSESRPEDVADAILSGAYSIEMRTMLQIERGTGNGDPIHALNEASVSRVGASMLGVDVLIDGNSLPTYWSDGLLVSTASGSTAYSLSVGGPICTPSTRVMIVAPVAPHNLNVRPLVIPDDSRIRISFKSRDENVLLAVDGRNITVPSDSVITISRSPFVLKKVRLGGSNFINALRSRLLWGEDVRNRK